jgi:hypothetical protein
VPIAASTTPDAARGVIAASNIGGDSPARMTDADDTPTSGRQWPTEPRVDNDYSSGTAWQRRVRRHETRLGQYAQQVAHLNATINHLEEQLRDTYEAGAQMLITVEMLEAQHDSDQRQISELQEQIAVFDEPAEIENLEQYFAALTRFVRLRHRLGEYRFYLRSLATGSATALESAVEHIARPRPPDIIMRAAPHTPLPSSDALSTVMRIVHNSGFHPVGPFHWRTMVRFMTICVRCRDTVAEYWASVRDHLLEVYGTLDEAQTAGLNSIGSDARSPSQDTAPAPNAGRGGKRRG